MSSEIKVKFSIGLLAIAVVGAVVHAALTSVITQRSTKDEGRLEIPSYNGEIPVGRSLKTLPQPYDTNYAAQHEVKQQCPPGGCTVTPSNPYGLRPGETLVNVGPSRVVQPTVQPSVPQRIPDVAPRVVQAEQKKPETKAFQLMLFLDGSPKSQDLIDWFKSDKNLVSLKDASSFQIYTGSNALYKERYSKIVAPNQFPAVVLQDASGGHIHACGKAMIPDSANGLFNDMREAYALYKQSKQGSTVIQASSSGAIKGEGYSWDDQIVPAMRLTQSEDECGPDGCDPPGWTPGQRVRDGLDRLLNRDEDKNALFWVSATELVLPAIAGLFIVLIVLLAFNKFKG